MAISKALFSSNSEEWETPQGLYDELNSEFRFNLDVCANIENTKCPKYFSKGQDALRQDWYVHGRVCWCNPPYGRGVIDWVKKAYEESLKSATVVMLLPSRTDVKWFHDYCLPYGEIRFIKGRLKFGGADNSAPFPSMVVIFRPKITGMSR